MFHLMFSLPALYVIARFIWPMPWSRGARVAATVAALLGSQYHLYCLLSSGSVFSPEMPRPVVIGLNGLFCAILLLALLQLVLDAAALVAWLVRFERPARIPVRARQVIAAVALLATVVGVQQALRVPPVKDVEFVIRDLPPAFDGYRILQLTDLHISRMFPEAWTRAVVQDANALKVDLVLVTGDVIDGSVDARRQDVQPLRDLRAADGVLLSPGNHEYFFGVEAWIDHLTSLGMTPLMNAHTVIRRQDARLVVAGVTDLTAVRTDHPPPDVAAALAGAPKGAPVLLLDHQPKNARDAAALGVSLQLSGHTHGGLIWGLDRLFARANGGFVSGRYDVDGMTLYVNNGTALWPGLALRLGKPSELTRITLRAR